MKFSPKIEAVSVSHKIHLSLNYVHVDVWKSSLYLSPLHVFDLFGLFFFVRLLQHLQAFYYLLFLYFTPLCWCYVMIFHHILFSVFAHMVSPLSSPLPHPPNHQPTHPCLLRLPSVTFSQRHCKTGGGVKRRWAPGNPCGAFQWQGPQVKTSRAEPHRFSSRKEESKGEEQGDSVHRSLNTHLKMSRWFKMCLLGTLTLLKCH